MQTQVAGSATAPKVAPEAGVAPKIEVRPVSMPFFATGTFSSRDFHRRRGTS